MPKTPATIDPARLRTAAVDAVAALKVLGNEDRLLLLCQLSQGQMCVSDLEEALDIRQPTLSQQLGVLRNEGVVATRRDGKRIFYSVADAKVMAFRVAREGVAAAFVEQGAEAKFEFRGGLVVESGHDALLSGSGGGMSPGFQDRSARKTAGQSSATEGNGA